MCTCSHDYANEIPWRFHEFLADLWTHDWRCISSQDFRPRAAVRTWRLFASLSAGIRAGNVRPLQRRAFNLKDVPGMICLPQTTHLCSLCDICRDRVGVRWYLLGPVPLGILHTPQNPLPGHPHYMWSAVWLNKWQGASPFHLRSWTWSTQDTWNLQRDEAISELVRSLWGGGDPPGHRRSCPCRQCSLLVCCCQIHASCCRYYRSWIDGVIGASLPTPLHCCHYISFYDPGAESRTTRLPRPRVTIHRTHGTS